MQFRRELAQTARTRLAYYIIEISRLMLFVGQSISTRGITVSIEFLVLILLSLSIRL